jgi:hypothetical protein
VTTRYALAVYGVGGVIDVFANSSLVEGSTSNRKLSAPMLSGCSTHFKSSSTPAVAVPPWLSNCTAPIVSFHLALLHKIELGFGCVSCSGCCSDVEWPDADDATKAGKG